MMHVYIGYRNLPQYAAAQGAMGGVPTNPDDRLTTVQDDIYLLTYGGRDYAVTPERAAEFIDDVLSKTTSQRRGFFPLATSYNGKDTAAVIEISHDRGYSYYDMDADELHAMLAELKDGSGAPLDQRGLINHCYPNPVLPEGDYRIKSIYHQIYYLPSNRPVSVIDTFKPDKKTSHFWMHENDAHVTIREGDEELSYDVPMALISEIKEMVRTLCADPAEAYVENGNWESYVYFGEKGDKRIFTSPDKTLELLKNIASKSTLVESKKVQPAGGMAMPMSGFMNMSGLNGPAAGVQSPAVPDSDKCSCCGAPRTGGKFCTECGREF